LSVILGVIDDQVTGYACNRDDFIAAKQSLEQTKKILDLIKTLGFNTGEVQYIDIYELLLSRIKSNFATNIHIENNEQDIIVNVDPDKIIAVLRIINLILSLKGYANSTIIVTKIKKQDTPGFYVQIEMRGENLSVVKKSKFESILFELLKQQCSMSNYIIVPLLDEEVNNCYKIMV
jgi:hypothetical protein